MKNKLIALAFAFVLLGADSVQAQTPCEDIQNGWDAAVATGAAWFEDCKEEADDWFDWQMVLINSDLNEAYNHFVTWGFTHPVQLQYLGTQANYDYAFIEWQNWQTYLIGEWEDWYCECLEVYQDWMIEQWVYYDSYAAVHDCDWDDYYDHNPSTWPVVCD